MSFLFLVQSLSNNNRLIMVVDVNSDATTTADVENQSKNAAKKLAKDAAKAAKVVYHRSSLRTIILGLVYDFRKLNIKQRSHQPLTPSMIQTIIQKGNTVQCK